MMITANLLKFVGSVQFAIKDGTPSTVKHLIRSDLNGAGNSPLFKEK